MGKFIGRDWSRTSCSYRRKTLRGTKDNTGKPYIHMVSAWACKATWYWVKSKWMNNLMGLQQFPNLEILSLQENTITIDAMGCQTKIVEKIIAGEANYIIAAKENQKTLYQEIKDEFRFSKDIHRASTQNLDHGRIETRTCSVISDFSHLGSQHKWKNLKSIVGMESC